MGFSLFAEESVIGGDEAFFTSGKNSDEVTLEISSFFFFLKKGKFLFLPLNGFREFSDVSENRVILFRLFPFPIKMTGFAFSETYFWCR